MLTSEQLGLEPATARPGIAAVRGPAGTYRAKWKWPDGRFTDQFLLAVCPDEPGEQDLPLDLPVHLRALIDRASWEGAGRSRQCDFPYRSMSHLISAIAYRAAQSTCL